MVETCDFVKLGNSQAPRKPWERGWETLESIFIPSKCFSICSGNNVLPEKQILFVQQCFPKRANRKTLIENIIFPQQCFLACSGLKISLQ